MTSPTDLFVRVEGAGPPVVLVHGFSLDHRMWDPQVEALRDACTVIRYDVRGFGLSPLPPPGTYSHGADFLSVLRHCGVARAHVVGLSMGGRIALRCALQHPEAVASVTLMDAAVDGQVRSDDWQRRWDGIVAAARSGAMGEARRLWMAHPLFAPARAIPAVASLMGTMVAGYSGWHWLNPDRAEIPMPPALERLGEVGVPALVAWGALDLPEFVEVAGRLVSGIRRARGLAVPGAGHMVNLEAPGVISGALRDFIAEVERAGRTTRPRDLPGG